MNNLHYGKLAALITLSSALWACGGDNHGPGQPQAYEFEITITNLTAGQPLSPATLILHDPDWHTFVTGTQASVELEYIAEVGDNAPLLASIEGAEGILATEAGAGPILPGGSESFQIRARDKGRLQLSYVAMLGNTNDGFAALDALTVSSMKVGQSVTRQLISYDSGTEANSESADTVPGPASVGGLAEGFNASRDDIRDQVYVHAGVVSVDDGLSTSTLSAAQRWDNPVALITVTRL